MLEVESTFIEDPFDQLKLVGLTLIGLFVLVVLVVGVAGNFDPPARNGLKMSLPAFLTFIFFGELFIFAIILGVMSCTKKKTITCSPEAILVTAIDHWGAADPDLYFRWSEITATDFVSRYMGKSGHQLFVTMSVGEQIYELFMLRRQARTEFDLLIEILNQQTPHLRYELVRAEDVANGRQVIVEELGYCKVLRETPPA